MQGSASKLPPNTKAHGCVRSHARVIVDASVRVFLNSTTRTLGRAQDISRGGMSVYVPLELAKGDVIRVMFELPHSRVRFGITGIVKNREGFRYGVEFLELTPSEARELERVLNILGLAGEPRPFLLGSE